MLIELFFTFFKIGLFSFGGGASMIPLLQQEVLSHGWLTEEALLRYIAISESTPGPIAVNMATFIGSSQGGWLGALLATAGVVLPSFVIILLIASILPRFTAYRGVRAVLDAIRPIIVGMILASGLLLALSAIGITDITACTLDWYGLLITLLLLAVMIITKALRKRPLSLISLILISAGIGMGLSLLP